ncbi:Carotenoid cleavage dioxygenase 8 protein [Thalictrum thalictroides]|uniref:Carotenoid cleavage dioxygenase 8 protein n=1 Tax=Thalictrum thalictroides TaxID=46969 RepID=A0A7J6WYF6_THATH|nr:Carotenoid cleavage dioxygenase 8 protein [Thalictrum thalictroides]
MDGRPRGTLEAAVDPNKHGRGIYIMDTARINAYYIGKKYRYIYGCGAHRRRPTNFPNMLTEVDLVNKTMNNWYDKGSIPSEPFFVPQKKMMVYVVISDSHGEGYALLLDGFTFEEIARAKFPYGCLVLFK